MFNQSVYHFLRPTDTHIIKKNFLSHPKSGQSLHGYTCINDIKHFYCPNNAHDVKKT